MSSKLDVTKAMNNVCNVDSDAVEARACHLWLKKFVEIISYSDSLEDSDS